MYRYSKSAASVRDHFRDHFLTQAGEVSWQHAHVRRDTLILILFYYSVIIIMKLHNEL